MTYQLPDDCIRRTLERLHSHVTPTYNVRQMTALSAGELTLTLYVEPDTTGQTIPVVQVDLITPDGFHTLARFDGTTVGMRLDPDGQPYYQPEQP